MIGGGFREQLGVSIVEILVALAVGTFLTAGVVQLMVSSKQSYRGEEQLARLQDSARYALLVMERDIRQAGFLGCREASSGLIPNYVAKSAWSVANNMTGDSAAGGSTPYIAPPLPFMLYGYDDGENPDAQRDWDSFVEIFDLTDVGRVDGTDLIQVSMAGGRGALLGSDMATASSQLVVDSNPDGLGSGQMAIISDCQTVDVFGVTAATTSTPFTLSHVEGNAITQNHSSSLSKAYAAGARVFPFVARVYFIGENADGNPALYVFSYGGNSQELVENVEDLQLLFGEDTVGDGLVDDYVEADSVSDWGRIYSVRINLLLRSEENITKEARDITFNGEIVSGEDRRLRLAFSSTVALRNRM